MSIQKQTLDSAITEAKNKLCALHSQLEEFIFPKFTSVQFKTNSFDIDDIANNFPDGSNEEDYIYIFKVVGQNRKNNEFINKLEIKKESQNKGEKDFPRINSHQITGVAQYLYVGRSHKLKTRIKQHLSENYCNTYAMHMKRWCTSLDEEVEILYFKLENEDNLFVQSLEDALWYQLKPCFGRKGDK